MKTMFKSNVGSVVSNVYVTNSYDFKIIEGNRQVSDLHVARLKRSIEEEYLMSPIIVNEKNEIIDGQHRFEAIKELGLPLYYIVCDGYGLPEVQRMNQHSRIWKIDDYLDGYASMGKRDYIVVKAFCDRHNWGSLKMAILLLNSNELPPHGTLREEDLVADFKSGNYKVNDTTWADGFIKALDNFQKYFLDYRTTNFVKAFKLLYDNTKYSHSTMLKKLEYQSGLFEKRTTIEQYAMMLTEIYNTRQQGSNRLYYLDGKVR